MDDIFLQHDTGDHPECSARLQHIHRRLSESGLFDRVIQRPVAAAVSGDLEFCHTSEYLERLQQLAAAGGGRVETDTVMSVQSADVAWHAAGAVIDAVEQVVMGAQSQAVCLVRPPGHHALKDAPMGFCLLSNVALAAKVAVKRLGLSRVLIVDWDVHHGNGTQAAVYEDECITFFSAHRFPFYPGTGRKSETGHGAGLGTVFNLPLKFGISRSDFLTTFESELTKAADRCRPELVIISAGFDAHAEDPVGSLGLETQDFAELTALVHQVAKTHAKGRLVSSLEGGYNINRLTDCVDLHLKTLLGDSGT